MIPDQILCLFPNMGYVSFRMLEGITDYAYAHDIHIGTVMKFDPSHIHESCKGLIVDCFDEDILNELNATGLPLVNLTNAIKDQKNPRVTPDDAEIGQLGAQHLMQLGQRHYYFSFSDPSHAYDLRLQGFRKELKKAGHKCDVFTPELMTPYGDPHNVAQRQRKLMREWLASIQKPAAIMAGADYLGHSLAVEALEMGLHIPEEIAILGVDNSPGFELQFSWVPLSTVDVPRRKQGARAVQILDEWIRTGKRPNKATSISPHGVIERQSTRISAPRSPLVDKALLIMDQSEDLGITIEDISRDLSVSRRTLYSQFKKELGRTPKDELSRRRIEKACRLLRVTDQPVAKIAVQCGYTQASNFIAAFRSEKGMPPLAFRNASRALDSDATLQG